MDRRKIDYVLLVFFTVVIILSLVTGNVLHIGSENRTTDGIAVKETVSFEPDGDDFCYEFSLPETVDGRCIAFNTAHFGSEVFIDGECVYRCIPGKDSRTKSTGFRWNFVRLSESDSGKRISIRLVGPYSGLKPKDYYYFGYKHEIYMAVIEENALSLAVSAEIFIVGLFLLFYSVFILKLKYTDSGPVFFAVFSILLAIWSITETSACDFMFSDSYVTMYLNYYSLMIMPIAFMMFLQQIYTNKDNIGWIIFRFAGAAIIVIRTVLDLLSIRQLRETLTVSQIYIGVFAVFGIILGINEFVSRKISKTLKINILSLMIILAATFIEILVLRLFNKESIYGMLGFVAYIIVMAVSLVKQSQKIKKRADEAEIYRKLAFTDELTGVFNRTAFRADLEKRVTEDPKTGVKRLLPGVIFMFDVNDLKKCNDRFGHENGDIYIKAVSGALEDTFHVDGRCYRIGGDEFCVLMNQTSQRDIDGRLSIVKKHIDDLNKKGFVVQMSVAAGYSLFDPEKDEDPDAAIKRADEMMYSNKQAMKNAIYH